MPEERYTDQQINVIKELSRRLSAGDSSLTGNQRAVINELVRRAQVQGVRFGSESTQTPGAGVPLPEGEIAQQGDAGGSDVGVVDAILSQLGQRSLGTTIAQKMGVPSGAAALNPAVGVVDLLANALGLPANAVAAGVAQMRDGSQSFAENLQQGGILFRPEDFEDSPATGPDIRIYDDEEQRQRAAQGLLTPQETEAIRKRTTAAFATTEAMSAKEKAQAANVAFKIGADPLNFVGLGIGKKSLQLLDDALRAGKSAEQALKALPAPDARKIAGALPAPRQTDQLVTRAIPERAATGATTKTPPRFAAGEEVSAMLDNAGEQGLLTPEQIQTAKESIEIAQGKQPRRLPERAATDKTTQSPARFEAGEGVKEKPDPAAPLMSKEDIQKAKESPEMTRGSQKSQEKADFEAKREAFLERVRRENEASARRQRRLEEDARARRESGEEPQQPTTRVKRTRKKAEPKSLRSWVNQSNLRISTDDIKRYGVGVKEDRDLILVAGSKSGKSADEVARQALSEGVIEAPPRDTNLTDWFMQKLKDNEPTVEGRIRILENDRERQVFDALTGKVDDPAKTLNLDEAQRAEFQELEETLSKVFKEVPETKISGFDLPPEVRQKIKEFAAKLPEKIKSRAKRFREVLQDSQVRVKKLQESPGVKLAADANPYDAEIRFHGRVGARLEDIQETVAKIDQEIVGASKKVDVPDDDLLRQVNEYLVTRHAPERNAALQDGAAGITTAEARARRAELEALPHFDQVKRIADDIQELNNQTLDILLEGQVITKELHKTLRNRYKNHVPLNRILEEEEDIVEALTGGKGFSSRGSGVKRAKGSDLEVDDIMTNVAANVREAIVRAEKNRVALNTLEFARNNDHLGIFEISKPKIIGKRSDGTPLTKLSTDPQTIIVRENGKPIEVRVKDPRLASALAGTNVNRGILSDPLFSKIAGVTRFLSGLYTRFNPDFPIPNIVRDSQEMGAYIATQADMGPKVAAKLSAKAVDPRGAIKDIYDALRGKDTPGAKLYQQMRLDGGTTGGMGLSTRKELELNVEKIRKINRSRPRKAAQLFLKSVDNLNTLFEDATRLTVYKGALERGLSRERAAVLAKEATINFNRKGTSGPLINGLYMFANASIQGSAKMARVLVKNPKVAAGVVLSVGAPTLMFNQWNDMVDPEWREKVREYDRVSGLPVVLSSSEEGGITYFVIPTSWGVKPIKVMWDKIYDAAAGYDVGGKTKVAGDIAAAVMESYNPVGGNDFIQALVPSFADVPVDIARNKAWHGGKIRPDVPYLPDLPESEKYFKSFTDKSLSQPLIMVARELRENTPIDLSPQDLMYALESYGGGPLRFMNNLANTGDDIRQGKAPDINSVPVARRFFKNVDAERIEKSLPYKKLESGAIKEAAEQSAIEKMNRSRIARDALEKFKEAKTDDAKMAVMKDLFNRDPRAFKTLKRYIRDDKKGLDYYEMQLKGFEPAQKAAAVEWEVGRLKDAKEKQALLDRYIGKKVLDIETIKILKGKGIDINVRESIKRLVNQEREDRK